MDKEFRENALIKEKKVLLFLCSFLEQGNKTIIKQASVFVELVGLRLTGVELRILAFAAPTSLFS